MSTPITGDSGSKTPEGAAARQIFSKPPFRLFFNETKVPGRSDISTSHPLTFAFSEIDADLDSIEAKVKKLHAQHMKRVHCTKGKFYSKYETQVQPNPATVEFVRSTLEAGPRDKTQVPQTESQRYGWYWDVSFSDPDILRDNRLNFRHQSNQLIKLQTLVNLASKVNKGLDNPK
ncbi:hypothetical protein M8J76_002055 [Diaphorina citri]|nr:hypothetical protein M8J75_010910 [Diaphorina citri]KAI5723150.1 hypothetical protein M8J76_002055 [Diaphorina citri]